MFKRIRWISRVIAVLLISTTVSFSYGQTENEPLLVNPKAVTVSSSNAILTDIDFQRTADGAARLIVTFDNDKYQMVMSRESGKLLVTLPQVALAEDQLVRLDVSDFSTPVSGVESFQESTASLLEIGISGEYQYDFQKQGNVLSISIEPSQAGDDSRFSQQFSGEPISLDFQDVPVRQVLQIIARVNGFNLVTTDTVTGNVTINLNNVPWDQALSMILKIKGLDKRLEGNILLIAPGEELASREQQVLQSKKQVSDLAPLTSRHIQINYAKAADLATILKSDDASILSARGTATVDERTNTLIIRDTLESIENAANMIRILDIPVKQVLIESRMVTVRDGVDEQIGIRWGYSDQQDSDGVSGSLAGAEIIAGGTIPEVSDRLNVNLPVSTPAGRIGVTVARLIDGTILDLELSALEQENKGEIIASPRITVANQHEAYIEQGTEIPYVQATSSGATSVEFKKAVLSMKVTPHITPDSRIILDLVVTQDTRGDTVSTSTGPAVAIDTQEISTQVLVENGETIVLGGIFQQTITDANSQVPLLGDLPIVGRLFKNTQQINDKRELLIFVTPKILTEAL
jgi:type IV pilus assembly protein PilQ